MYLVAVVLPPLAVLMCGKPIQAILSLFLTLCCWVPGIVHAVAVVADHKANERADRLERSLARSGRSSSRSFTCQNCREVFHAPANWSGATVSCPHCYQPNMLPL